MIMDNIKTVAALGLKSEQKYCLLRSSSETSFSEKSLQPSNELSGSFLDDHLSSERCCSTEPLVVTCSEAKCHSHTCTETLSDKICTTSSPTLIQGVKSMRVAVSRGGSLEDSLSPMNKPLSSHESFTSLTSVATEISAEIAHGK